uniref:Uncharacterized protein n=1 Tax=Eutreptiella gymnastica TaxID=73025 RepID=A0A7S1IY28_9EUGL
MICWRECLSCFPVCQPSPGYTDEACGVAHSSSCSGAHITTLATHPLSPKKKNVCLNMVCGPAAGICKSVVGEDGGQRLSPTLHTGDWTTELSPPVHLHHPGNRLGSAMYG